MFPVRHWRADRALLRFVQPHHIPVSKNPSSGGEKNWKISEIQEIRGLFRRRESAKSRMLLARYPVTRKKEKKRMITAEEKTLFSEPALGRKNKKARYVSFCFFIWNKSED